MTMARNATIKNQMDYHNRSRLITIALLALVPSGLLAEPTVIDLWPANQMPGPAPFVEGEERDTTPPDGRRVADQPVIRLGHVQTPQVHVYLPPKTEANGAGVVICPGGGFNILAWDLEGTEVAEWLNELGVAALVLKYRVPTGKHGEQLEPNSSTLEVPAKALGPMMDAQRALSLARVRAGEWDLDPERIGILGFSAGGKTAALAALAEGERAYEPLDTTDNASCRADFSLLIYPGYLAEKETGKLLPHLEVSETCPPTFFAHAADDRVTCLSSTALFNALTLARVPAALHVYARGGHGYGLRRTAAPVTSWSDRAAEWMRDQGVLSSRADRFVEAWNRDEPLPNGKGLTLDQAYALQRDWVMRTLDEKGLGGVKGGVVSPGGQEWLGITEPLAAILRASGRFEARDRPEVSREDFPGLRLETEIGFIIDKRIEGPLASVEAFRKHVSGIVPIIELVSGKWQQSAAKPTASDLVAINVTAAGYIVGDPVDPDSIDPKKVSLKLDRDGETLHRGSGADCWKGPWETGLWLANYAHRQGIVLEPGQVIICGALGKIQPGEPGQYRLEAGKLGTIEFTVTE